jgi:hypothetical protein
MIPSARPVQLPPALARSTKVCDALRDVVFDRGPAAVTSEMELAIRAGVDQDDIAPVVERVAACGAPIRVVLDGAWVRLAGDQWA